MMLVMVKRLGARLQWAPSEIPFFKLMSMSFKDNFRILPFQKTFLTLFNELDISTTEENISFECPESVLKLHVTFSKNTTKKNEKTRGSEELYSPKLQVAAGISFSKMILAFSKLCEYSA